MSSFQATRNKMMKTLLWSASSSSSNGNTLPDEVLDRLFSHTDMKQLVQMSTLCKRCINLWKISPIINCNGNLWLFEDEKEDSMKIEEFVVFVREVINQREKDLIVKRFHLSCDGCPKENLTYKETSEFINSLLKKSASVEEVSLQDVEIADSVLKDLAKTIPALTITNANVLMDYNYHDTSPCSGSSNSSSDDDHGHNEDDDVIRRLSLSCKKLEKLLFTDDVNDITRYNIRGPSLNVLVIKSGSDHGHGWDDSKISISAPNVKNLELLGGFFTKYSIKNLSALESSVVETALRHTSSNECYGISARSLGKLMEGLVSTKRLTLSGDAFLGKTSAELATALVHVSDFRNLGHFKLTHWRTCNTASLLMLLQKFPYLQTLVLQSGEDYCRSSSKDAESGNNLLPHITFSQLQAIEAENCQGADDEVKFLEYLVQQATELKNITFTKTKALSKDGIKRLEIFKANIIASRPGVLIAVVLI